MIRGACDSIEFSPCGAKDPPAFHVATGKRRNFNNHPKPSTPSLRSIQLFTTAAIAQYTVSTPSMSPSNFTHANYVELMGYLYNINRVRHDYTEAILDVLPLEVDSQGYLIINRLKFDILLAAKNDIEAAGHDLTFDLPDQPPDVTELGPQETDLLTEYHTYLNDLRKHPHASWEHFQLGYVVFAPHSPTSRLARYWRKYPLTEEDDNLLQLSWAKVALEEADSFHDFFTYKRWTGGRVRR